MAETRVHRAAVLRWLTRAKHSWPTRRPDALWDDWDSPLRVPDTPELHLDGFDGSLDLLLDLRGSGRCCLRSEREEGRAFEAFLPEVATDAPERELRCRVAVAGTFLAGLELTRDGSIIIQQSAAWTPIELRPPQASR